MSKKLTCTSQQLIDWLYKHLDDCPTDWETDDFSGREGTAIIFHTEEEDDEPDEPYRPDDNHNPYTDE